MTRTDLIKIHTAPNPAVAEMMREMLENEGIPAFVRPPRLSPYIGVDEADILVAAERADEARRVIRAFLEAGGEADGEADE